MKQFFTREGLEEFSKDRHFFWIPIFADSVFFASCALREYINHLLKRIQPLQGHGFRVY
jgi:hypothetical protein